VASSLLLLKKNAAKSDGIASSSSVWVWVSVGAGGAGAGALLEVVVGLLLLGTVDEVFSGTGFLLITTDGNCGGARKSEL
jgi:hypothetical protein